MNKHLLTDLSIRNLQCPADILHLEFFGTELPGFYVDVLRSCRKSYRLRYRIDQKLKVTTLGDAKLISLKSAQKLAQDFLLKVKAPKDPAATKPATPNPSAQSFGSPSIGDFFVLLVVFADKEMTAGGAN